MGEIGIPRHDFLYDLRFWEVRRIIHGYRRRGTLRNQLIAMAAYCAMYAFRGSDGKTAADVFPQVFDDDDDGEGREPPISEDEVVELQEMMSAMNAQQAEKKSTGS